MASRGPSPLPSNHCNFSPSRARGFAPLSSTSVPPLATRACETRSRYPWKKPSPPGSPPKQGAVGRPLSRSAPEAFWAAEEGSTMKLEASDMSALISRTSSTLSVASLASSAWSASTDRSARSTRNGDGVKFNHFITGNTNLNNKAGHDVFRAKLVRLQSIKEYLRVFKGMKTETDGSVSIEEFEKHLVKKAPKLLKHAQGLYKSACRQGASKGCASSGLDFRVLLTALFPAATLADIQELMDMAIKRPSSPLSNGPTEEQKADAQAVFDFWNKSETKKLTFEEAEQGMMAMNMPLDDMESSLAELYGEPGTPGFLEEVCLEEFTAWFASTDEVMASL